MKRVLPLPLALAAAALALGACSDEPPTPPSPTNENPGLVANPRALTFRCVTPGCDTSQDVQVSVTGTRRLAAKRIVLSDEERTDFVLTPEIPAPFVVPNSFKLNVRHLPQAGPDRGAVSVVITWADPSSVEGDPNRVPPGELKIPLYRRMLGEPELTAAPAQLAFGAVAAGSSHTVPLTIGNGGYGNLALQIAGIESSSPLVRAASDPLAPLLPGQSANVNVTFSPKAEAFTRAVLTVRATDPDVPPVEVTAVGTSIAAPAVACEPEAGLDFGRVPKGSPKAKPLLIVNRGGAPLEITRVSLSGDGSNLEVPLENVVLPATLQPLEALPVDVHLLAAVAGPVEENLIVESSDPLLPSFSAKILALVTDPAIQLTPAELLDFGLVPQTWVQSRPVTIGNSGWGTLVVKNISLSPGSSNLFGLRQLPPVTPVLLEHGESVQVQVQFRAETVATFTGEVSVESNDARTPFAQLALTATGAKCEQGCPMPNAIPDCLTGLCEIAYCPPDRYDLDHDPATGCECAASSDDPGGSCDQGKYFGRVMDDGSQINFADHLPEMLDPACVAQHGSNAAADPFCFAPDRMAPDVDVLRFFAEDGNDVWFSDDFHVRMHVATGDPGLRVCFYRHDRGGDGHDDNCYLENVSCPAPSWDPGGFWIFGYDHGGSWGPNDSADYTVVVERAPGAAPTCMTYGFWAKNG